MTQHHEHHDAVGPSEPVAIGSEDELEQVLSEPTSAVRAALGTLDSDLYILGVAGKMGPTLARMAARALQQINSPYRVYGVTRDNHVDQACSQASREREDLAVAAARQIIRVIEALAFRARMQQGDDELCAPTSQ